jgi:hypothetical protein
MPKEVSQVSWSKRACEFFTLACFAVSSSASGSPSCEPTLFADLRAFVFPRLIETEGHSRALDFRDEGYQFDSLEEINRFNVSGQHLVKGTGHVVMLRNSPLESPYWAQIETTGAAPLQWTVCRLSLLISSCSSPPDLTTKGSLPPQAAEAPGSHGLWSA